MAVGRIFGIRHEAARSVELGEQSAARDDFGVTSLLYQFAIFQHEDQVRDRGRNGQPFFRASKAITRTHRRGSGMPIV